MRKLLRAFPLTIAAILVLFGGVRLWTSGPDAVHITITHVDADPATPPVTTTVIYDRTTNNGAVAQRLQRDLAALPLADPFRTYSCPIGRSPHDTIGSSPYGTDLIYEAYTLTWYRAGLPVEQASADDTGCAMWRDDGVFVHLPVNVEALYADIYYAVQSSVVSVPDLRHNGACSLI